TDAQFDAAEKAAAQLTKLLDEGKRLEADKSYAEYAEAARQDVKVARTRIDALWSEVGLTRLKAELEPVRKDLAEAAQALHTKKREGEEMQEGRTVASVVKQLLEKNRAGTTRSGAAVQYVRDIEKSLREIEVELQRRTVDVATAQLDTALKGIAKPGAGDDAF